MWLNQNSFASAQFGLLTIMYCRLCNLEKMKKVTVTVNKGILM